ncbi:MAG TPA: polysaccharide deacetylase family protein [Thermoanaerobaculia bacterium]|nr:polysaccharide deacetylase family protein [Thermoanaerobaculia bacterium]
MPEFVTIVAYHYVRELARSRYPEIKGLDVGSFREQLGYIRRHYKVISAEELMAAVARVRRGEPWDLPENAALLTFDDGYSDHYRYVFPLLDEARLPGCFFPPVQAIIERKLLDVNKIHFLLASGADVRALLREVLRKADEHRHAFEIDSEEELRVRWSRPSRYDPEEVVFLKRLLQTALPAELRSRIVAELFAAHVTADEVAFAEELYLSSDQLRCMIRHGMYVGSHGYSHVRLGFLPAEAQAFEIDRSLEFLASLGAGVDRWILCYPYGDSNGSLLEILRGRRCTVGLTTQPRLASSRDEPLLLPRLDTNDLPSRGVS